MKKTTVLLPIEVPDGAYCWDFTGKSWICEHFDNSSGCNECTLHLGELTRTTDGILKAEICASLKQDNTLINS